MNRLLSYKTVGLLAGILILCVASVAFYDGPFLPQDDPNAQQQTLNRTASLADFEPISLPPNDFNTPSHQQANVDEPQTPPISMKPTQVAASQEPEPAIIEEMALAIATRIDDFQRRAAASPNGGAGLPRGSGRQVPNPTQQKAIDRLLLTLGDGVELQVDNYSRTLRYLRGDLSKLVEESDAYRTASANKAYPRMAAAVLQEIQEIMNIADPLDEFIVKSVQRDELGMTKVALQQTYRGTPVYGSQVGVFFDADHTPIQVSGLYAPSPIHITDVNPRISDKIAIANAKVSVAMKGDGLTPSFAQPSIYWNFNHAPILTYQVELTPAWHQHWTVFVSAQDGQIVHKTQMVCTLQATGQAPDLFGAVRAVNSWQDGNVFYMVDTTKPFYDRSSKPPNLAETRGAIVVMDAQDQLIDRGDIMIYTVASNDRNTWNPTAVSVLANFGLVEDYYRRTFNRVSIDDNGMNIVGIIHPRFTGPDGNVYKDNAFWNPGAQMMIFGDGEHVYRNLPGSLDVAAHELTHGVINHTADLIYENQSGALNEHIADFFGAMVDRGDWYIGDGIAIGKEALRDMRNPRNPNVISPQPESMSEFVNLPNTPQGDNGGVHINSGIPNRMTYLLADGANGIGRDATEQIVYRALTRYLTPRSQFIDYRRACVSAASDLFGANSAQVNAVQWAFDQVEIFESGEGETHIPTPGRATQGSDLFAFLVADLQAGLAPNGDFYYMFAIGDGQQSPALAASRYVSNTRPAISGDGQYALYVDATNNLWVTDFQQEEIIWDQGNVRTIALSKNGRHLAFTTTDYSNAIYILDFQAPQDRNLQVVELLIPDTGGNYTPLNWADVLTFNFRGDELLYDAVVSQRLQTGASYDVWGIYSLRMADMVSRQISAQTFGEQIGNPALANTSDHNLLADYLAMSGSDAMVETHSINFLQRQVGILDSGRYSNVGSVNDLFPYVSQPSFSGNDAQILTRLYNPNEGLFGILERHLTDDRIAIDATRQGRFLYVDSGPIWHPVGFRRGVYTEFKGEIEAPASIAFPNTPLQMRQTSRFGVRNRGNADLQLIGFTIEGADQAAFRHSGFNQLIAPGLQVEFDVEFAPLKVGQHNAVLVIQSTDPNLPRASISLTGVGAQVDPTPTPTATPVPSLDPTPTPPIQPAPTPTPAPAEGLEPILVYEFDQPTLAANGWVELPGGFNASPPGAYRLIEFSAGLFPDSVDGRGLRIDAAPGEVAFLFANAPIDNRGAPILLVMTARASSANAGIFLVGLKGNLSTFENVDGSVMVLNPATSVAITDEPKQFLLLYEPDTGSLVTPAIQAVSVSAEGSATVWIDRLEAFRMPASLFNR